VDRETREDAIKCGKRKIWGKGNTAPQLDCRGEKTRKENAAQNHMGGKCGKEKFEKTTSAKTNNVVTCWCYESTQNFVRAITIAIYY